MIISKEALVDLQEKYEKVKKLIEEDSKLDPESEPYLSKYAARNILISMNANLENMLRQNSQDSSDHIKLLGMIATVQLLLGIVSIDTEELSVGEKHLTKCQELIEGNQTKPELAFVTLHMYNQLGILWSKRESEVAQKYLEKSESFYFTIKDLNVIPIDPNDLFDNNLESYNEQSENIRFEKGYTLTLFYLAQIHGSLGNALRSSVYCHNTLKRQLEYDDYESIDWALNSATLSQFFMQKHGFKQARHHLAASNYILDKHFEKLNEEENQESEEHQAKLETYKHRSADVARCWLKYGLMLLTSSKERLLKHIENIDAEVNDCDSSTDLSTMILDESDKIKSEDIQNLFFPSLDLKSYEEKITDQFLLTFDDAKQVFLIVQTWINQARSYYTIDTLASDYIEIVQDESQSYDSLVFYEENPDNQAKLYKRAADALENVVKQINPTYYLHHCRQIWFRLGQIYSDMIDIKSDKLKETTGRPSPVALTKINTLTQKSITHFQAFIDSFMNPKKEMPKVIEEDFQKPFLQAYFHIGALNGRFITLDKKRQLENSTAALEAYKKVADYCKENPKAEELIPAEMGIIKEMLQLLPIKLMKLRHEVQQSS
ncbi:KIF-binding protein-like [Onthophagus taurus]|uniref:KIF-binding protein-like n=1 Tax=Onthophagus taurus TaxID=166361 RepID=UPI000C203319|nr:KIF1-binding protein homolog [Onthophagus taurus]